MKTIREFLKDTNGAAAVQITIATAFVSLIVIFGLGSTTEEVKTLSVGAQGVFASANEISHIIASFLTDLAKTLIGPSSRLFPLYLVVALLVCAVLYRRRNISVSFFTWLFPKSIYFHASHIVDLKVFLVNRLVSAIGLFNLVLFNSWIAATLIENFSTGTGIAPFHPVAIAILLLMVSDFSTYWVHRIHHENRIIWPFHSLHHSAEVMTPVTVYRKHPVYDLLSSLVRGVLVGVFQGLLLILLDQDPSLITIASVNSLYVLFNLAGSNLRHSHVWLSFGPVVEHIFISPAQHQIHHSIDPRHHNKNYGEVLAIWDWMFGTLYVPRQMEDIEFGLGDKDGKRLRQPHDSLTAAMVVPVKDSYRQIRKRFSKPRTVRDSRDAQLEQQQKPAGAANHAMMDKNLSGRS